MSVSVVGKNKRNSERKLFEESHKGLFLLLLRYFYDKFSCVHIHSILLIITITMLIKTPYHHVFQQLLMLLQHLNITLIKLHSK